MKNTLFELTEHNNRPGTEGELSTGLGLLLCKEFVEKHQGSIKVKSEPNMGSSFSIKLKR
jgi:two-component system, sensor histidine kinase and response regulator